MCEITNENFGEKYQEILNEISSSDFIALDCEFSGLSRDEQYKFSLFDNPSEIYQKIRRRNEGFIAFQIGITSFRYSNGKYEAATYTFHLFPRNYSRSDEYFLCDASCIQFLSKQNFDFNKVFRDGVTYMKASNESVVRQEIDDGSLVRRIRGELTMAERDVMKALCSQVFEWYTTAKKDDTIVLDVAGLEPFTLYLIREEIESRCPSARTCSPSGGQLRVVMNGSEEWDRKDELFAIASGFTRLLKQVIAMKKPIVGHNMFTDLLVIYKMFIGPLPNGYDAFKKEITGLFPVVYDTKCLSRLLEKTVGKRYLWSWNALLRLYDFLKDKGSSVVVGMPVVEYKNCETLRCKNHHDSGFDSYCTGYVFLKMSHMFSMWNPIDNAFLSVSRGDDPVQYFDTVRVLRNRVNVAQCNLDYIALDGPDPVTERPDLILMESLSGAIDITTVSNTISKYNADIKMLTRRSALIAPLNKVSSKMVTKQFARNRNYRLTKYKPDSGTPRTFSRRAAALTLVGGIGLVSFFWYISGRGGRGLWTPAGREENAQS